MIWRSGKAPTPWKATWKTTSMPRAESTRARAGQARVQSEDELTHHRRPIMQGKKTHEQQVRILERKDDVPGARRTAETMNRTGRDDAVHRAKPGARQSEFPVSRGGLNQESDHNKHNDPGQSGHKPQQPGPAQQKR